MNLEQLRQLLQKIVERMEELSNSTVEESGSVRSFSEEESVEYNELEKRAEETEAAIQRCIKLEERRAAALSLGQRSEVHIPRIEVGREHNHNEEGDYRGFTSLGDQLQAVRRSCTPGSPIDNRLEEMRRFAETRGASGPTGASSLQGSDGGFAVQSDFSVDLMQRTYDQGVLAGRCARTPISAASDRITRLVLDETSRVDGSRWSGIQAYWREQAATATATRPKYKLQSLELKSLMAFYVSTEELLADASALQADVMRLVPQELAFKLDDAIVRGAGVGQPLGLLNAPAKIKIAKENGQTADTVVAANVRKMNQRLYVPSDSRAEWFINQFVEDQLLGMYITGSNSDFFPYIPAGGIAGRPHATLFGKRVNKIEHASAIGDEGDIMLADLSQYELIEKGGIQAVGSIHVYFLYAEQVFRFMMRANGAPLWQDALTPYKGSDTVSPFLTLAAR